MKTNKRKVDFDDYAQDYRKIATKGVKGISGVDSNYFGEYKVKLIREEIHKEKGIRILDLGCGDGFCIMCRIQNIESCFQNAGGY